MPFDPYRLTSSASINRVRIVDLPGLALEESVKGKTAYELLSRQALVGLLQQQAEALRLPTDQVIFVDLPILFDHCFEADDSRVRAAAQQIARHFGRRLGYLILTLVRGDAVNRRARADWDDTYWLHWAGIQRIWLGGGLVSGHLGARAQQHAQEILAEAGLLDCAVHLSPYPAVLSLVGAARCVPPASQAAVVFDFGHNRTKAGCAAYANGRLTSLRILPALPAGWNRQGRDPAGAARAWAEYMVSTMADTWRATFAAVLAPSPVLVASIACYVLDGHPVPYENQTLPAGNLRAVSHHLGDWLSDNLSRQLGRLVHVDLIHDGTAAAQTYAGTGHSATLTLGTALGIGFPPPMAANLRPISAGFRVQ